MPRAENKLQRISAGFRSRANGDPPPGRPVAKLGGQGMQQPRMSQAGAWLQFAVSIPPSWLKVAPRFSSGDRTLGKLSAASRRFHTVGASDCSSKCLVAHCKERLEVVYRRKAPVNQGSVIFPAVRGGYGPAERLWCYWHLVPWPGHSVA